MSGVVYPFDNVLASQLAELFGLLMILSCICPLLIICTCAADKELIDSRASSAQWPLSLCTLKATVNGHLFFFFD